MYCEQRTSSSASHIASCDLLGAKLAFVLTDEGVPDCVSSLVANMIAPTSTAEVVVGTSKHSERVNATHAQDLHDSAGHRRQKYSRG